MSEKRYQHFKNLLEQEKCFKMICGAGNEDKEHVKKLSFVYTLAGASVLDISANPEVVTSAKEGINMAFERAHEFGVSLTDEPFIMVSVGMPGDHHVRKSYIDPLKCIKCNLCAPVCPTDAIPYDFTEKLDVFKSLGGSFEQEDQEKEIVIKDLCIGCGKCSNICPKDDIISYRHNARELEMLLPECIDAGAECFELHAAVGDDEVTIEEWKTLQKINPNNFNSICLDRLHLGNFNLEKRIEKIKQISGRKFIVQADGYPMSGGEDDFNTTIQAVACADVINKKFNMIVNKKKDNLESEVKSKISSKRKYRRHGHRMGVYIVLSGGTNSLTKQLADMSSVRINGVAVGTYARDIVEKYVQKDDFYSNTDAIKAAYEKARSLVLSNVKEHDND